MRKTNKPSRKLVICINNESCEDLKRRKIYEVLIDEVATKDDLLRVIDDSVEDYLYPASKFVQMSFAPEIEQAVCRRPESTTLHIN